MPSLMKMKKSSASEYCPSNGFTMSSVEVKLELGHRAVIREKVTQEGFTHDWTVFVRGSKGYNINIFVEKVVFHLHESFPKPKRVVKEPPFSVSESGYAGFIMPIDVYFRSREEPKKVTFMYNLYLRLEGPPVSYIRTEKLTFQNASDDFRSKLIKAGGEIKPSQPPTSKQPNQPFTDIFGSPIRTKNSPDSSSTKSKDSGSSSQSKSKNTPNSSSSGKEGISSSKESHKSKDSHHANKESHHTAKEGSHQSSPKDIHPPKEPHPASTKESVQEKDSHPSKDSSHPLKESHRAKEIHHKSKKYHKKGHKKENQHSSKEVKSSKDPLSSSDSKVSKSSKSVKSDKESSKSAVKRAAPTDSHGSHGNTENKKKLSPVSLESSSEKSSSQPKHKTKEGKEKSEKQKIEPLANSVKKEEEKPKRKGSPAPPPPEPMVVEPKEIPKTKPSIKPPSPPPDVVRLPSPLRSGSLYSDDSDDEPSKSLYSPSSSILESSLYSNIPQLSDHSIISPLSDDSDDDILPPSRKRKINSDLDLDDDVNPEPNKTLGSKPPKLNKKQHAHSKSSSKVKSSENFHRGNGSINSEKQKIKPLANSFKKEEKKPKRKGSPAPPPPEPMVVEPKEIPKTKPSPKPPSPPPRFVRLPSPPPKFPSPLRSGSFYSDDSDDESSKSLYSSPASSISESSFHRHILQLSHYSLISPLSDDSDDILPPSKKRKINSDLDLDGDVCPEPNKTLGSKSPKLNKKEHAHSNSSSKVKSSENFHRGNGSINSDICVNYISVPGSQDISNHNNTAYREELMRLQRTIMSLNDRRLIQNIVDLIATTGDYEITESYFEFDLLALDYAVIQKIKAEGL